MTPSRPPSSLTAHDVQALLRTRTVGRTFHYFDSTDSTNRVALELAQRGAEDGTVVVADAQTAGRGRHGRIWFSPPGENLYCSLIVRQCPPPDEWSTWLSWAPLVAALAVAEAIYQVTSRRPSLKWPNDLLLNRSKIGGLLCEGSSQSGVAPLVVIGVGINVNTPPDRFPENLRGKATSLLGESGHSVDRVRLCATVLNELEDYLDQLRAGDREQLAKTYARQCVTLGQEVTVRLSAGEEIAGVAESIGKDGSLQLRRPVNGLDGIHSVLLEVRSGEVQHVA